MLSWAERSAGDLSHSLQDIRHPAMGEVRDCCEGGFDDYDRIDRE